MRGRAVEEAVQYRLEELYNEPNIVNVIKSSRLRWAGHIVRMDEKELPKNILWTNPGGNRGRCRQKSRWFDGMVEDTRKLCCRILYLSFRASQVYNVQ